jgi:ElaB/YqjD/DUF883 family membrane-anchored ribosome-binding protein
MDKKETLKSNGNGNVALHDWEPYTREGIHKNADQIENDIEETRHVMDDILDNLADRINPSSIVNRVQRSLREPANRERVKNIAVGTVNRITDSFQRNPLPLMLITAGITWQLWESQRHVDHHEYATDKYRHAGDAAESSLSNTNNNVQDNIARGRETFHEKSSALKEHAADIYESNKEKLRRKGEELRSNAQDRQRRFREDSDRFKQQAINSYRDTVQQTRQRIYDNPLFLGLGALFAGLVLGSLLPETKTEQRVAGGKANEFLDKSRESGENVIQKGKDAVKESVQTAAHKADERVISPENTTPEDQKSTRIEQGIKTEIKQTATAVPGSAAENKSGVLKTAEQKLDDKKNK